ncbi:sugar kinase [Haloferax sp. AS1]|uniref:sugar kinase n=1 Tax=Haloferax sp. AS1 TaxID=2562277 RepID=UPI00165FFA16|nr:sugar kinase [Haloferax sp. AS1]MBC9985158.1 sugar kinase [Haloferax sp. AS1]
MTKVPLELLGIEVDTDDPGESAQNLGLGVVGVALTMGVVGAGAYLYNTARQKAGVTDDDVNIPGV